MQCGVDMSPCHTLAMADFPSMADEVVQRLGAISDRAIVLSRGIGLLASAAGGFGYLIGLLVLPSSWRLVWLFFGLVCIVPAIAVWMAHRRLRILRRSVPDAAAELRSVATDKKVRVAMMDLVDRDEDHDQQTPLIQLGKELLVLRSAIDGRKDVLTNLWQCITALTGLPGLLAIGTIGSFLLLIGSAVAVVVRLALLH